MAKHTTEYLGREKPWQATWQATSNSWTRRVQRCHGRGCVSDVVHGEIYISAPKMNFSVALVAIALEYETANV